MKHARSIGAVGMFAIQLIGLYPTDLGKISVPDAEPRFVKPPVVWTPTSTGDTAVHALDCGVFFVVAQTSPPTYDISLRAT